MSQLGKGTEMGKGAGRGGGTGWEGLHLCSSEYALLIAPAHFQGSVCVASGGAGVGPWGHHAFTRQTLVSAWHRLWLCVHSLGPV